MPDAYRDKTLPDFLYRVQPPDLEPADWAIDLRIEVAVEKTFLVDATRQPAFATETELIAFADFLGRRRDRAALSNDLTDTVGHSLRQRRRKGGSFKKTLRQEVYLVCLNIDEGTRSRPTAARVHVITDEKVSDRVRKVFAEWEDEARPLCEKVGIKLYPCAFHERRHTDIADYETWVKLDLG